MAHEDIVNSLKTERDRLDLAIQTLEGDKPVISKIARRVLSPAARAKISKAMRSRWKKTRAQAKREPQRVVAAPAPAVQPVQKAA